MLAAAAVGVPLALSSGTTFAAAGDVWAVSKEASGISGRPTVPDGGGRAFFGSSATDVVGKDANGAADAFWRRRDGVTTKISTPPGGGDADGASSDVQVSADGKTVAFATDASNLWNSDHNEKKDIYACTRTCFSVGWVARGMEPDGDSMHPRLSADGKWVAFASDASNWVKDDTNGVRDVFVANVRSGAVTRVSVSSSGAQLGSPSDHPSISADGQLVTFSTRGRAVPRDTNTWSDVYLRDLTAGRTSLVSQSRDEKIANRASGSAAVAKRCLDGKCFPTVVFTSTASNLVGNDTNGVRDVFVRERGSTARISVSKKGALGARGEGSWGPSISRDGRYVAFASDADLTGVAAQASDQGQILLRDRSNGSVRLLSGSGGVPGNGDSAAPSLSPNGKYAAFQSRATNLDTVTKDNHTWDVFVTTVY
jgi:Tol biopolymer transport system component